MEALANKNPDYQLVKVDIARWGSPVAQQFSIRSIPHFILYDGFTKVAEGQGAWAKIAPLLR